MEATDLLTQNGTQLALTAAGQQEANRLLRAHRLWEAYLQCVGTPVEELHRRADQLEHMHDDATIDYLDDKLGHPLTDPHGAVIPEASRPLEPGAEVNASLLREGRRAEIISIAAAAAHTGLVVGQLLLAGPRHVDGNLWTFILSDSRVLELDHDTVDAIQVRLLA